MTTSSLSSTWPPSFGFFLARLELVSRVSTYPHVNRRGVLK
jgi:hypothetical protein